MKRVATFLLLLTGIGGMVLAAGQDAHRVAEQTLFTNSSIQNPVTPSGGVIRAILATHPARERFAAMSDAERANPGALFQAGEVHLGNAEELDLVVVGMGEMKGADTTWFWVVGSADKAPAVLLFSGGDSLEVLTSKTKNFRDIRTLWSSDFETETTIYHFDGGSYQMWKADNFKILKNPNP